MYTTHKHTCIINIMRTHASSNSHFKGLQTVMTRLRSLIIPNLISPRCQINWSPDHRTPSRDYAHDSSSSTIYTQLLTSNNACTHTQLHTHSHNVHTNLASSCVLRHFCPLSRAVTAPEKRQGRQHHYTTPIQTQLTTQVWTSLIFLHHTATNLLNVTGSKEFSGYIRPNQTKTVPSLSHT